MDVLGTLSPKARAEILRLLFANPSVALHQRELARLGGLALRSVQNECQKLLAAELLRSRRDGNRLYFSANTDHLVYPDLRSLAVKTSGIAEQLRDALTDLPGIEFAFIYGSMAAGEERASSDVDLMIIGGAGLRTLSPRTRPVSEAIGREINIATFSRKGFQESARKGDAFIRNVLASEKNILIGAPDELAAMA